MTIRTLLTGCLLAAMLNLGVARADDATEKADKSKVAEKTADKTEDKKPAGEKAEAKTTPADDRARLSRELENLANAEYIDTQLGDVVNDLEARYHVNIELDVNALTADGKGSETIINCNLKQMSLSSLLTRILKPVGLSWTIVDEVILITTPVQEETYLTTKVYSVADFADSDGIIDYEELSEMLQQSVAHESWRAAGGSCGVISKVTNKKALVITQTYHNQLAIAAILKQLAEK